MNQPIKKWTWRTTTKEWAPARTDQSLDKPPSKGSHLAYASDGLRFVKLEKGVVLSESDDKDYFLGSDNEPLGKQVQGCDPPREVEIGFCVESDGVTMTLGQKSELTTLAEKVGATAIKLKIGHDENSAEFTVKDGIWKASAHNTEIPCAVKTELSPFGILGTALEIKLQWKWQAQCLGLVITHGTTTQELIEDFGRYRRCPAGLVFDTPIPAGLKLRGGWMLDPTDPVGDGRYGGMLKSQGNSVSLLELAERKVSANDFEGTGFSAAVTMKKDLPRVGRYYAIVNDNTVGPSPDWENAWSYGPANPVYPPNHSGDFFLLEDSKTSGVRYTPNFLKERKLPTNAPKPNGMTLLLAKGVQPPVVGVFKAACHKIPEGTWSRASALKSGEQVLCWRGLVDEATVKECPVDNKPRQVVALKNGFVLGGSMWIAAPFAGVGMQVSAHEHITRWCHMEEPDTSFVAYHQDSHEWEVRGRWIRLDSDAAKGESQPAEFVEHPACVVLASQVNVDDASGPIIEIGPPLTVPRLRGWLTDCRGIVNLHPGSLAVGSAPLINRRFREGEASKAILPENLWRVLCEAEKNSCEPSGEFEGVRWKRYTDGVQFILPSEADGIYVLAT